ncbi:MAG: hypothetical protein VX670_12235 [Candidatus Latescibacterota bacterium]|nr:hypothetical protein [Candidatus Latescibacterota bacterium]
MAAEFNHARQQVRADLHQPEAAVIAFATGVNIAQFAYFSLLEGSADGLRLGA